jgi:phage tail-like protein
MADAKVLEPYRNFKFLVYVQGFIAGGFSKVSGLKMTTEVFEYREGGDNTTVRKLPGQTKFDPVSLERGSTSNLDMWNWATEVHTFSGGGHLNPPRRTITIVLVGKNGLELRKWVLQKCWASEWEVGELDAKSNDVLIERVVVQHEGIVQQEGAVEDIFPPLEG